MAARPKRVALKFCGGCDPGFDRSEYWEAIRAAAGESITWVRLEDQGHRAVLVINGCPTACPVKDLALNPDVSVLSLTDRAAPPEEIVARLLAEGEEP